MSNLWIRAAFALVFALVVALTIGFGVAMVFPGPRPPDTPSLTFRQLQAESDNPPDAERLITVVDRFYQDAYDFRRAYPAYQRNVFVADVILAIIVGSVGLALAAAFNYLRLGLILGAILVLVFGLVTALLPAPNPAPTSSPSVTNLLAAGIPPGLDFAGRFLRFAVSFVALLVYLFLGLWRLTDWAPAQGRAATTERRGVVPENSAGMAPAAPEPNSTSSPPGSPENVAWRRPDAG